MIRAPLTDLLGIRYPIAASAMRNVSGPSLVKDVP